MISIRPAVASDAQNIGAVFDAAVREGWTYLGPLARKPMFPPDEWDTLVAEHTATESVFVATDPLDGVVGFTAVHPQEGEMFLTRTKKTKEQSRSMKPAGTGAMGRFANQISAASTCGSRG
jgi:hypothetical protein